MIGRNKRGNRQANMKARLGIATAVLVGGSAVGVAAVAAASHGPAATSASSAGFSRHFDHAMSEQAALSSAFSTWGQSQQTSLNTLSNMQQMRTFNQVWNQNHRTMFAAQRGVVVLATRKFLLVKSMNGSLHLWWLTGGTKFFNVSNSQTGWAAMTGSTTAAQAAMVFNNTTPATTTVAGSTSVVSQLTTPVARPTTVVVSTGNVTVTVVVTTTTATVTAPTTTTTTSTVVPMTTIPTATTQWNWAATRGVQRGDLVFVAGQRVHGFLIAKLVLFAPPTTGVTPTPTPSVTVTPTATAIPGAPTPSSTSSFTGTKS